MCQDRWHYPHGYIPVTLARDRTGQFQKGMVGMMFWYGGHWAFWQAGPGSTR